MNSLIMLCTAAAAAPAQPQQQSPFGMLVPMLLILAIFYFMMIRPQQRKEKERRKMIDELRAGAKIVFAGGLMGTIQEATDKLRAFLFEHVYLNPLAKAEETKAKDVVCTLFDFYVAHPDRLPDRYRHRIGIAEGEDTARVVADFISGMTDRYAIETYQERYVPHVWRGLHE